MNTTPFMRADSSETLLATPVYANVSSGGLNRSSTIPIPAQNVSGRFLED